MLSAAIIIIAWTRKWLLVGVKA